jgi:hypothetical protein
VACVLQSPCHEAALLPSPPSADAGYDDDENLVRELSHSGKLSDMAPSMGMDMHLGRSGAPSCEIREFFWHEKGWNIPIL